MQSDQSSQTMDQTLDPPDALETSSGVTNDSSPWLDHLLGGMRSFWINSFVLLIVLLTGVVLMNNGDIALPDDGVYAAQSKLLAEQGTWSMQRPAPHIDIDGSNSALGAPTVWADRQIPHIRHPLHSLSTVPFFKLGGFGGLLVYSVLGTWGASIAAGLIARRLNPTYGLPALWLMGLASPLLFDAYLVSAASMAAAMTGLAFYGLMVSFGDNTSKSLLYALPCAAAAVFLRSEAIIIMAALVVAIIAFAVVPSLRRAPHRARLNVRGVVTGMSVACVAGGAYLLDVAFTQHLRRESIGSSGRIVQTLGELSGPGSAAWTSLFRPWDGSFAEAQPAIALVSISLIAAAVALKVNPRRQLLPIALLMMAAVSSIVMQFGQLTLVTGLFAAFPVLPAGVVLLKREDLRSPIIATALLTVIIATVSLILTIYADGGSAGWGGRFFHSLLPIVVPLTVVGLRNSYGTLSKYSSRSAAVLICVICVSISIFGLRSQMDFRQGFHSVMDEVRAIDKAYPPLTDEGPSTRPLVIVGTLGGDGAGRFAWNPPQSVDIVSGNGLSDVVSLVRRAHNSGYDEVIVISNVEPGLLTAVTEKSLGRLGWRITHNQRAGTTGIIFYWISA